MYCLNYWWNSPQVDHQLPKQFGVKTYYSNSNNISGLWTTFGPGPKTKHCCRSEAHSCCHLLEVGLSDKPEEICSDTRSGTRFHNPLPLSDVQRQGKLDQIHSQCRDLWPQEEVVIRDLARLLGLLQPADRALVVARLHYWSLQCHQIKALKQLMQEPSGWPMHAKLKHCYSMSCHLPEVART